MIIIIIIAIRFVTVVRLSSGLSHSQNFEKKKEW